MEELFTTIGNNILPLVERLSDFAGVERPEIEIKADGQLSDRTVNMTMRMIDRLDKLRSGRKPL